MSEVYYFGAWGEPGHYLYGRCMAVEWEASRRLPWPVMELDGQLAGDPALVDPRRPGHWKAEHQPEGRVRLHHKDGWAAIAFWDRSGDGRYGSNSAFIARGELSADEMLALFEASFPSVWKRITERFPLVVEAT